ncbi:DUF6230 family protein, partial [Streptomyces chitinivorans]
KVPVAVSAFKSAELRGLCQSVVIPVPVFGDVSVKLNAGNDGKLVEAKNLYIDLDQLDADPTFKNIHIAVPANDPTNGPAPQARPPVSPRRTVPATAPAAAPPSAPASAPGEERDHRRDVLA